MFVSKPRRLRTPETETVQQNFRLIPNRAEPITIWIDCSQNTVTCNAVHALRKFALVTATETVWDSVAFHRILMRAVWG